MDVQRMIEASQRLAAGLKPDDLDATLHNLTKTAVEVLPHVHYASVSVLRDDGRLESVAQTDPVLVEIDEWQNKLSEGPCYRAAEEKQPVVSPKLATDDRFGRYALEAVRRGVLSQAGVPLFDTPGSQGALNLYSRDEGTFESLETVSTLFASHAAVALEYAREVSSLKRALKTRELVGKAIGIVMERFNLPEDRAFAFLTRLSQNGNVKLRVIAEELIATVSEPLSGSDSERESPTG